MDNWVYEIAGGVVRQAIEDYLLVKDCEDSLIEEQKRLMNKKRAGESESQRLVKIKFILRNFDSAKCFIFGESKSIIRGLTEEIVDYGYIKRQLKEKKVTISNFNGYYKGHGKRKKNKKRSFALENISS